MWLCQDSVPCGCMIKVSVCFLAVQQRLFLSSRGCPHFFPYEPLQFQSLWSSICWVTWVHEYLSKKRPVPFKAYMIRSSPWSIITFKITWLVTLTKSVYFFHNSTYISVWLNNWKKACVHQAWGILVAIVKVYLSQEVIILCFKFHGEILGRETSLTLGRGTWTF